MDIFRRKLSLILSLIMIVNLIIMPVQAYASNYDSISNEYIEMNVNSGTGWYTFGTLEGNPDYITDNNKKLLYGYDEGNFTTYTTMNINDELYEYGMEEMGGELISLPTIKNDKSITSWSVDGIEVKQIIEMVGLGNQGYEGTFKIRYEATNTQETTQKLGVRIMMDTMLGTNDGAPIRIFDNAISDTKSYSGDNLPAFWQAFDSISDPTIMAQGNIWSLDTNKPDRFVVDDWDNLTEHIWDVVGVREIFDSAVAIYWDQEDIKPHETKYYETYYGVASLKTSDEGSGEKVSIAVAAEDKLQVTENGYSPNPFEVRAYVSNNQADHAVAESSIRIELPEGLKLKENQMSKIDLEPLVFGMINTVLWQVVAEETKEEKLYNYSVIYTNAEGEEIIVQKEITVPALSDEVPILQYVDVGTNTDEGLYEIHIFGCNYSLLENMLLFSIKLVNNDTQSTIELDASKLTRRSDSELIISTNNLEIGTYDLIIDHPIFDSKRFNNAIVVNSKQLNVNKVVLESTNEGTDIFNIELSDKLSSAAVTNEEVLTLKNRGSYYSLDILGVKNNSNASSYEFENSNVTNQVKLSERSGGIRLTFSSATIDSARYVIDDSGKNIRVTVEGHKNANAKDSEKIVDAVANQGATYTPETTEIPKKVSKLKVGVFELKGSFKEYNNPIYEYVSSGTVAIGNNMVYSGGKIYVDMDRDLLSCENGRLYAPTSSNISIPITDVSFDLVARTGEKLELKNMANINSFEVGIATFEFADVEVFKDSQGAGLALKDFGVSLAFEKAEDVEDGLGFKIGEFKIYESGKVDASFEVSASLGMDLDLKGVAALKELSGALGFEGFKIKKSNFGGKVELYCLGTTFGAKVGFDFDHWEKPYVDEFEISGKFNDPIQIPIGPVLPSLDQGNKKHLSYLTVLREIKFSGEKITSGSYSDPANFTGTTVFTDGVSPEIQDNYLLNIEGAINVSSQYAKIKGDFGLYMFDLADGEVVLYWVPRLKFAANGKVNIAGTFTGKTIVVAARDEVQFDLVGTLSIPDNVWFVGGTELAEQEMSYDFNSGKFFGTSEVCGHGIGVSIDVNPDTVWYKRAEFKFFGNKYQKIDALIQNSIKEITPGDFYYGTNIELISSFSKSDEKYFALAPESKITVSTGAGTVVSGDTSITFEVDKQYEGLMLDISYCEDQKPRFTLSFPDNEKYKFVEMTGDISQYANYSVKDGNTTIFIDPSNVEDYLPTGTYTLSYEDVNEFDVSMSYVKPMLEINKLAVKEKSEGVYDVEWAINQEVQTTTPAAVKFYLSSEKDVYSGQKVKELVVSESLNQSFEMNLNELDGLTEETYYLYAKLEKEGRVPDRKFADEALTFQNNKLPQAPKVLSVKSANGQINVAFEKSSSDHVSQYFVGVLNENGGFDYSKSFTRIANVSNKEQYEASVECLELEKDYKVAVLSVATYDDGEGTLDYIGKPSEGLDVYLHTPQPPSLEVTFSGIEGQIKSNSDENVSNEFLSNTVLTQISIENLDANEVTIRLNDENVTISKETSIVSSLLLEEGYNRILCIGKNEKGDSKEYIYDINVDTIKPFLTVDNYSAFVIVEDTEMDVTGEAEKISELLINGSQVSISEDGKYKKTIDLPAMNNTILVELTDMAGNKSSVSFEAKRQLSENIHKLLIENMKTDLKVGESVGGAIYLVDESDEKVMLDKESVIWKLSNESILEKNAINDLVASQEGECNVSAGFALSENHVIWSQEILITVKSSSEGNKPADPPEEPPVVTPDKKSSKRSDQDKDDSKRRSTTNVLTSKEKKYNKMIGSTGGDVVLNDVKITIPDNLIADNTLLSMTNDPNGLSVQGEKVLSYYYNIKLGNYENFNEDITIELPLKSDFNGEKCAVYYYNETRDKWLYIGGSIDKQKKTITFVVNHLTCFTVLDTSDLAEFSDTENRWGKDYIRRLVGLGIVNGINNNQFAPTNKISRAEFMTMLYRALELEDVAIDLPFEDNDNIPSYALKAVKALHSYGIVNGSMDEGNYLRLNATTEISRAEVCKLVYDYLNSTNFKYEKPMNFTDQLPDWSADAIKALSSINIVNGYEDGTFKASSHITREEAAKIIYLLLNKLHI